MDKTTIEVVVGMPRSHHHEMLSDEQAEMVEQIADQRGVPIWKVILDIIDDGLERAADQYGLTWT